MKKVILMIGLGVSLFADCKNTYKYFVSDRNTTYDIIKYSVGDASICKSNNMALISAITAKQDCINDKDKYDEIVKFLDGDGTMIKKKCIEYGYK